MVKYYVGYFFFFNIFFLYKKMHMHYYISCMPAVKYLSLVVYVDPKGILRIYKDSDVYFYIDKFFIVIGVSLQLAYGFSFVSKIPISYICRLRLMCHRTIYIIVYLGRYYVDTLSTCRRYPMVILQSIIWKSCIISQW